MDIDSNHKISKSDDFLGKGKPIIISELAGCRYIGLGKEKVASG